MTEFYRDVLGLEVVGTEPGWTELRAGACFIALHKGTNGKPKGRSPKLAFYAADVEAVKADLVAKGVAMGKTWVAPEVSFCDGVDPDGNAFSLSNRR